MTYDLSEELLEFMKNAPRNKQGEWYFPKGSPQHLIDEWKKVKRAMKEAKARGDA